MSAQEIFDFLTDLQEKGIDLTSLKFQVFTGDFLWNLDTDRISYEDYNKSVVIDF